MLETERRENKEGKNDVGYVGQKRQKKENVLGFLPLSPYTFPAL